MIERCVKAMDVRIIRISFCSPHIFQYLCRTEMNGLVMIEETTYERERNKQSTSRV